MSVSPGQALKVVASLVMPGTTIAQNVYYAQYTGAAAASNEDVTADCTAWVETMMDTLEAFLTDVVSLSEVTVSKLVVTEPPEWEQIGIDPGIFAGIETMDTLPNGVALVVRVATTVGNRLARKYIPGISEGYSEGAAFVPAMVVAALLYGLEWIAGPADTGGRTYVAGIVSQLTGFFSSLGQTVIASVIPGYQRRRKPGVGV